MASEEYNGFWWVGHVEKWPDVPVYNDFKVFDINMIMLMSDTCNAILGTRGCALWRPYHQQSAFYAPPTKMRRLVSCLILVMLFWERKLRT